MEEQDEALVLLNKMMAETMYAMAPKWKQFPGGFRWRYFGNLELRSGVQAFCWSTTRNANGKFLSWIYQPRVGKKKWEYTNKCEHRLMKDAKARALKLYNQHWPVQQRNLAAMRKAQAKKSRRKVKKGGKR